MTSRIARLWNDDRGQDMAEYAIMLGVVAAIVVGVIAAMGTQISTVISDVTAKITG